MSTATVYFVLDALCLVIMLMLITRFLTMKGQIIYHRIYFTMILMAFILVSSDMVYELREGGILSISLPLLYIINDLYFISGILVASVWFTYTCKLTKFKAFNTKKAIFVSYIIPIICSLMTISSFKTQWIFYFDEAGCYQRGSLNFLAIFVPILYLFFCFIFTLILFLVHRDQNTKNCFLTVASFSLFPFACIILQAFLINVPILCIGETLAMLHTFISIILRERDELIVQEQKKETSILTQAMESTVQEYILIVYLRLDQKKFRFLYPRNSSSDFYDYSSFETLLKMSEEQDELTADDIPITDFLSLENIQAAIKSTRKLDRRYTVNGEIYNSLAKDSSIWSKVELSSFFELINNALSHSDINEKKSEKLPGVPLVISIISDNNNTDEEEKGASAILTIRNISQVIAKEHEQQKKIEEALHMAESASKAKADFLARMSHEIRTPINAVLGMNTMILREADNMQIKEYAANIETSGSLLLSLINDVLDMSKIESGKMEIVPVEYSLSRIMNDLYNMAQSRINDGILQLIMNVDSAIPENLRGDEVRIRQIVTNLLTNAIKYTAKGSITLTANYKRTGEKSIDLIISVKDTGKGISKENQGLIFNAFQRVDEISNRNIEGTGLGLSITKSFIDMMHGHIFVESTPGVGSTFTVIIPQEAMNDEPVGDIKKQLLKSMSQSADNKESFTAPNARVLVVDDNKMNLLVISKLLGRTKIHVDKADGGNACIDLVKKNRYDLILLDHMMPAPDGIETLSKIKQEKLAEGTPIVALTANAMSGAKEQYLSYGFDAYLSKPVVVKDLENLLLKLLPKEKIN